MIWRRLAAAAAAAARRLDARQHDLVDVQEAVLLQADVDERRLEPGEHVVDAPLVDVADDRARAAALEVELGDPVAGGRVGGLAAPAVVPRAGLRAATVPGRLEQRDPGLAAVDADQHLLLQLSSVL